MLMNMRLLFAILWTFGLLLHFDQLFSSKLQSEDRLCTNRKFFRKYTSFKNDKIVTEIYLKNLGTKNNKKVTLMV